MWLIRWLSQKLADQDLRCFQNTISLVSICMLDNFACFFVLCGFLKLTFTKENFQKYHLSTKQVGFKSGYALYLPQSGSKLFAKAVSRRQKWPLVGKELRIEKSHATI